MLDGIARALHLDEADRMHLFDLDRAAKAAPSRRASRGSQERVRPVVQRVLDSLVGVPAFVESARLDVLAANRLGGAFYAPHFEDLVRPVNGARFVFLNRGPRSSSCTGHHRRRLRRHAPCRSRPGPLRQEALRPHR